MDRGFQCTLENEKVVHLCEADPILKEVILAIGDIRMDLRTQHYEAFLRTIVGQQLSAAAARTIWNRVSDACPELTPEAINDTPDETFRSAGVSKQKISYIRSLTEKVLTGELDFDALPSLSDEEVILKLTSVKGIGTWSAEMFLIFSLGRENILSFKDAGLKRAIKLIYGEEPMELMPTLYEKWSPYNSIASLYLWESIDSGVVVSKKG